MSGNFEAKNYMYRKNKDGIIVGLVVHPNDVDAAFAALPIGARVMIGWAAIGDDEKPIEDSQGGGEPTVKTVPRPQANEAGISKPKKRFEDLPIVQQCVLRCNGSDFFRFMIERHGVDSGGRTSAEFVRWHCGVKSRSELAINEGAAKKWRKLEAEFEAWQADEQYAGAQR